MLLSLKNQFLRLVALLLVPGLLAVGVTGCGGDGDEGDGSSETSSNDSDSKPGVEPPPVETAGGSKQSDGESKGGDVNETSVARADTKQETPPFESLTETKPPKFEDKPDPNVVPNEHDKWIQNFEQAKAQAQKEGKDILADFTGSDWCGWCIRLHNEVFQYKAFHEFADDKFVLLELDFPRNKSKMTDEIIKQNEELQARFEIQGFPTILLLDAEGRPYAQTGYQAGGPQVYADHLGELREIRVARDEALAAAGELNGLEKAKKIDEALQALPADLVLAYYKPLVDEIKTLDADDAGGLLTEYTNLERDTELQKSIAKLQEMLQRTRSPKAVLERVDKVIEENADFPKGVVQLKLLKLNLLAYEQSYEDVLKISAELLKQDDLEPEQRFQAHLARLQTLDVTKRTDEALTLVDEAIAEFKDLPEQQITFFLAKASFLKESGKIKEAKESIAIARKAANPGMLARIDRFEELILADAPKPDAAPDGADAPAEQATGDADPESGNKPAAPESENAPETDGSTE